MTRFFLQRLLLVIPVIFGVLTLTFILSHSIKGDPCRVMLGERATEKACAAFRERFGLDRPLPEQYARYLALLGQGDFGTSIKFGIPVSELILDRLPVTLELALGAMLFATTIGLTLGVLSAVRHNSLLDLSTMIAANVGISMPIFWLGLMLIYLFAILLKDSIFYLPPSARLSSGLTLPPLAEVWHLQWDGLPGILLTFFSNMYTFNSIVTGRFDILKDVLWHLILPSFVVGTIPLAIIARITRSAMLEVLGADYIRTARAKGLRENVIIVAHGLRNALLPIVTVIGLQIGSLLSGAVLTETTFSLPGMGRQLVDAIIARDYPVVQAFVIVVALIYVIVNTIVDLSYSFLDPRVRMQ